MDIPKRASETPNGKPCYFDPCARCSLAVGARQILNDPRTEIHGPFHALEGKAYCEFCFPIVAAVKHAKELI